MSFHTYIKEYLGAQPGIRLLAGLGGSTIWAMEEVLGPNRILGRETKYGCCAGFWFTSGTERLNPYYQPTRLVSQSVSSRAIGRQ
jgi:hypothetical protein